METVVVPAIKRANPDTTKTLSRAGVSTIHEPQGRMGLMKPYIRPGARVGTRDVADLQQLEFSVWSRAISKQAIQKTSQGMIICKKQRQLVRRRYFMAVCWRKHAARLQYDFTEAPI